VAAARRSLCGLYIASPGFTSNSNAIESTFGQQPTRIRSMNSSSVDSEPGNAWCRTRRYLEYVRDWPENGNSPYSPVFCLSLLLAVGLIIEICR